MTFTLEEELCFEAAEPAEPEEEVDFGVVVGVPAGAANVLDGQLATDGSVIPTILQYPLAISMVFCWSAGEHAFWTQQEMPDIQSELPQIHLKSVLPHSAGKFAAHGLAHSGKPASDWPDTK